MSTPPRGPWRCTYDPHGVFQGGYFHILDIRYGLEHANWADGTQFVNERTREVLIISDGQTIVMREEDALFSFIPMGG